MFGNSWFKKQKPLPSFTSLGGGSGGILVLGGPSGIDATGGTKTTDGDYTIHTFTNANSPPTSYGTLTVTKGSSADLAELVVVGGGGGGGAGGQYGWYGGGGGAGG